MKLNLVKIAGLNSIRFNYLALPDMPLTFAYRTADTWRSGHEGTTVWQVFTLLLGTHLLPVETDARGTVINQPTLSLDVALLFVNTAQLQAIGITRSFCACRQQDKNLLYF